MKRATTDRLRRVLFGTGFLGALLLLTSCGVTEPDTTDWQDVSNFCWPTELGTRMVYKKVGIEEEKEESVSVALSDEFLNGEQMYVLQLDVDTDEEEENFLPPNDNERFFLTNHDTLIVRNDRYPGGDLVLKSPVKKGNRWISDTKDGEWEAEIVDLYAYRKVEGKLYKDVVAVRYRQTSTPGGLFDEEEVVRFFARGIGEILVIRSYYPESNSNSSQPLPRQESRQFLVETTATQAD